MNPIKRVRGLTISFQGRMAILAERCYMANKTGTLKYYELSLIVREDHETSFFPFLY
jgi:hypothetical protein